jgi:hypothetical protein
MKSWTLADLRRFLAHAPSRQRFRRALDAMRAPTPPPPRDFTNFGDVK